MPKLRLTRYQIEGPLGEIVGEISARGKARALEEFKKHVPRERHRGLQAREMKKL